MTLWKIRVIGTGQTRIWVAEWRSVSHQLSVSSSSTGNVSMWLFCKIFLRHDWKSYKGTRLSNTDFVRKPFSSCSVSITEEYCRQVLVSNPFHFVCWFLRERVVRGGGTDRQQTLICCSTYWCIHCSILACALTEDQTHNLGVSGCCSNQLSYAARAPTRCIHFYLLGKKTRGRAGMWPSVYSQAAAATRT